MSKWISKKYFFLFIIVVIAFAMLISTKYYNPPKRSSPEMTSTQSPQPRVPISITATSTFKTYRNEEWGFKFRYPQNWTLDETFIYGQLRKFHLVGVPLQQERLIYDTSPPFMLDIVTLNRAERLTQLFYELKNPASEIKVGDVIGSRYEYEFDRQPRIAVVLPLGQYKLILESDKEYEDIFGQMVTTFKFWDTAQTPTAQETTTSKTYHNTEFRFEFQYPENWLLYENTFGGSFSKFNLIGSSPEEDGYPDPIAPPFLINIVTPDFADRAVINIRNLGGSSSTTMVADTTGTKYVYEFEVVPQFVINIPFGEYRMLLGATKDYEDVFNQILATFKFLK